MTATGTIKRRITPDFSDLRAYNRAYVPLCENKSEFLHLFGSAGSGKSRFAAQREIMESFEPIRKGRKTLVIRKIATTLKDSVYAELKTVIHEWGFDQHFDILKSPLQITNKLTGVAFLFIGLDDVEKVKSITGVDRIWVEEATELTDRSELDQLRLRLRGFSDVQITLTYNPIDEHHWLNTEIHQELPDTHYLFHSTYKDNEQLLSKDPNYAKFIESTKDTNPNYYRVYGLGLWGKVVEGLIYADFEDVSGVIPTFPQDDKGRDDIQFYGLDFGYSNPTALIAQHVQDASPKKLLINKEVLYEAGLDGPNLVRRFDEIGVRKDRPIIGDSARPEMIATLKSAGYNIRACEKFAGSVVSGINRLRKYQIRIVAGSKNLIKEIHNYQKNQKQGVWVEEPAPNQIDHGLDAMRYGEQTQPDTPWVKVNRPNFFAQPSY
jgi:phage terminase large subunit